ncbi:hypothetical protein O0I10_010331 [Lichtheimia ornata]|uniref:Uncharacterized protein n=1 Tax=Lichtheimia ornata TaxID=688661 RepID=A0AAD7UVG3_9FUNG|nr:uncharacterized protein O0I10_010331 [Lichtheimia ornata]KAJ8653995.1 hypothetical protein O0I10_010331 [Lichtheimia ornata]
MNENNYEPGLYCLLKNKGSPDVARMVVIWFVNSFGFAFFLGEDRLTSNVLGLANSTLGASFRIKLANPRFRNVATSQTGSGGRPLRRRRPKKYFSG